MGRVSWVILFAVACDTSGFSRVAPSIEANDGGRADGAHVDDSGSAVDASARPDATQVADSGTGDAAASADAQGATDVGASEDAGAGRDAALAPDGSADADAGLPADSAIFDVGARVDVGVTTDAGLPADSAILDVRTLVDVGVMADAGVVSDSGAASDAGPEPDAGTCGDGALANPTLSLHDQVSGAANATRSPTVRVVITGDLTAAEWHLTERPRCPGAGAQWETTRPMTFELSALDGDKEVFLWIRDSQGDMNPGMVSATIALDRTPPPLPPLQWAWELPHPHGNNVRAAWSDGQEIFSVAPNGVAMRLSGAGDWRFEDTGTLSYLFDVYGDGQGNVYACSNSEVLHRDASGQWSARNPGAGSGNLEAIWAAAGHVVTAGQGGRIHYSPDGRAFTTESSTIGIQILDLWGSGPTDLYGVGGGGLVLHREGPGFWRRVFAGTSSELHGVWGSGPSDVFIVGQGGYIGHWDGAQWTTHRAVGSGDTLLAVWGDGLGAVYAVGGRDVLEYNGGATWSDVPAAPPIQHVTSVAGAGGAVYVLGNNGFTMRRDPTGTWTVLSTSGALSDRNGIWGGDPRNIYVAAGSMLYSTGEGDWTATSLGGSGAKDVHGSGPGSVYAVGYSGVWQSAGGPGATWTPINAPSNDAMRAVWVADQGAWVYVVGDDGLIARLPAGSSTWQLETPPSAPNALSTVWGTGPTNVYVSGVGAGMRSLFGFGGAAWDLCPTAGVRTVWGIDADRVWGVGGQLMRADDPGCTWASLNPPAQLGQNLFAVWASGEDNVFASGSVGQLAHYDGQQWTVSRTGATLDIRSMLGFAADDIYVVANGILHGSRGFVLRDQAAGTRRTATAATVDVAYPPMPDAARWAVGEGLTTTATSTWPWSGTLPATIQLSAGAGLKTVYLWAQDAAGNMSPRALVAEIERL